MIQVNRFNVSRLDRSETKSEFEYQIRWVGETLYYKRPTGTNVWSFCTNKEFAENVSPHNLVKWHKQEDLIPGGIADQMSPSEFNPEDLMTGIRVEMEHTSDVEIAKEIAMDHLAEDPEYYEKLKNIHN